MPNFSNSAAGLLSRVQLMGKQGVHRYSTAQVWVPAGLHGACSSRPKSRNPASNRGIAFRPATANQAPCNPPKCHFSHFLLLSAAVLKCHSSRQRIGSHGTTAALQTFPCMTATNGASACGFVSVRVCVMVGSYSIRNQEPSLKNIATIQRIFYCSSSFLLCCLLLLCLHHTVSF